MRPGLLGSRMMVCRHIPPAPGCHFGPVPWPRSPGSSCQLVPPSVERNRAASSTPRVNRVPFGPRRFEMANALELPWFLRAVVPLVRGQGFAGLRRTVVNELVACGRRHRAGFGHFFASGRLPGFAAVVGALNDLPEPAAGLRGIQPVRVNRRSLDVVQLPAREMRTADVPAFALAVRL